MVFWKRAINPRKKETPLKQFNRNCPNCKRENSVTVLRCENCGKWFDKEVITKLSIFETRSQEKIFPNPFEVSFLDDWVSHVTLRFRSSRHKFQ